MVPVPFAYKLVACAAMLAEINFATRELHLPDCSRVKYEDVRAQFVFHPAVIGFAGRLDTEKYSFAFAKSGRLRFITRLDDGRGNMSFSEYQRQLSLKKSQITTNDAYQIAARWLRAIEVDLPRLEKAKPPAVRQRTFPASQGEGNPGKPVQLPVFDVKWGDWADPAITVSISGVDQSLLVLRQEDDSYSKRPVELIRNIDKLLAIPDEEFVKYSPAQLKDLVTRFAVIKHPERKGFLELPLPPSHQESTHLPNPSLQK